MSSYVVVIERGEKPKSFGAYVPDLPGCVAVGSTAAEVRELIRGAIAMHLNGMREDGLKIPKPSSTTRQIEVGRVPIHAPLKWVAAPHKAATTRKKSNSATHAKSTMTKSGRKKATAKPVRKTLR